MRLRADDAVAVVVVPESDGRGPEHAGITPESLVVGVREIPGGRVEMVDAGEDELQRAALPPGDEIVEPGVSRKSALGFVPEGEHRADQRRTERDPRHGQEGHEPPVPQVAPSHGEEAHAIRAFLSRRRCRAERTRPVQSKVRGRSAARAGSCVTMSRVRPSSAATSRRRAKISRPGVGIQRSGRLVGEQDGCVSGDGAGNGDALPLADGELVRSRMETIAQPDAAQDVGRLARGHGPVVVRRSAGRWRHSRSR